MLGAAGYPRQYVLNQRDIHGTAKPSFRNNKQVGTPTNDFAFRAAQSVSPAAAVLVTASYHHILSITISDIDHWKATTRSRGAYALAALVPFARPVENYLPSWLPGILQCYSSTFHDLDANTRRGVVAAARALGASCDGPGLLFEALLLVVRGTGSYLGTRTAKARFGAIGLIYAIGSMSPPRGPLYVDAIATVLATHTEKSMHETAVHQAGEDDSINAVLCCTAASLISKRNTNDSSNRVHSVPICYCATMALARMLLLLSTFSTELPSAASVPCSPSPDADKQTASRSLFELAAQNEVSSVGKVVQVLFADLLISLPVTPPCYDLASSSWLLVRAILSAAPEAAASMFEHSLRAILLVHANPSTCSDADTRLQALR